MQLLHCLSLIKINISNIKEYLKYFQIKLHPKSALFPLKLHFKQDNICPIRSDETSLKPNSSFVHSVSNRRNAVNGRTFGRRVCATILAIPLLLYSPMLPGYRPLGAAVGASAAAHRPRQAGTSKRRPLPPLRSVG